MDKDDRLIWEAIGPALGVDEPNMAQSIFDLATAIKGPAGEKWAEKGYLYFMETWLDMFNTIMVGSSKNERMMIVAMAPEVLQELVIAIGERVMNPPSGSHWPVRSIERNVEMVTDIITAHLQTADHHPDILKPIRR